MVMNWSKRLMNFKLKDENVNELQRIYSLCYNRETCCYGFEDYMNLIIQLWCRHLERAHDTLDEDTFILYLMGHGVTLQEHDPKTW